MDENTMTLLVIDAQRAITDYRLFAFDRFVLGVGRLIDTARKNGTEVIFVRHDDGEGSQMTPGTDGFEIYTGFAPEEDEKIFDKRVNSPFRGSGLLEYLREKGETSLMVTGLQTDYCIDATVKCGFEHGFEIIVPEYCNTTFDNDFMTAEDCYHYYNEFMWNNRYARSVPLGEALELLVRE